VNRENGAERFSSSARLDVWLKEEGRAGVDADAFARVLAVREVLHDLVVANATGVDGLLAHLGLTVAGAVADGSWPRLKACQHCHWVVFDPSKNRSSRWCSMSACGGRHNAKEYRRRQAGAASSH